MGLGVQISVIVIRFILTLSSQIVSLFINYTCIYKLEMFPGQQMIRDQIPEEPGLLNFYEKLKKHVTVKNILVNKVNDLLSVLHTRYPIFY
jgi:hypothetical protein